MPVARPSRSSGCGTCVRRKVRCDKRKPTCLNCEKGFHGCTGYDRPHIFVSTEDTKHKSSASRHQVALPTSPSLHPFQPHIIICFLRNDFFVGFEPDCPRPSRDVAPTLSAALQTASESSPAYISALALAEALFAHVHKIRALEEHSKQLHVQALRSLRVSIGTQLAISPHTYSLMWSCLFLGLYDVVSGVDSQTWLSHARGLSAMVQSLGPSAFQSPAANTILQVNRSLMVFAAIVDRKRMFLERQEWQTIPWVTHRKIPVALIEDLLCAIPGLFQDLAHTTISRDTLLQRVSQLSHRIATLRWEWEHEDPCCCWESAPSPAAYVDGKPIFDSVLSFTNEDRAIETVYFDMLQLLLCEVLQACDAGAQKLDEFTDVGPLTNATLSPGLAPNFEGGEVFAMEICRCVDFLSRGKHQGVNAFVLHFPLAVANGFVKRHRRVDMWLSQITGKGQ